LIVDVASSDLVDWTGGGVAELILNSGTANYSSPVDTFVTVNGGVLNLGDSTMNDLWINGGEVDASSDIVTNGLEVVGGTLNVTGSVEVGRYVTLQGSGSTAAAVVDRTFTIDSGTTLTATLTSSLSVGAFVTVLQSGGIVGTFDGLTEGATFTMGSYTMQISYLGGSGNDITLKRVA
jgi:fibronectin-binding autotransporter adhesin